MESPGEYLKREREHRGVALESIFEATRVPLDLLQAIESDNFGAQHPTFIKGFIRSYCKHLGLDENDAVLRYEIFIKEQVGKEPEEPEVYDNASGAGFGANTVRPESKSRRNVVILALLGVAAILLFYIVSSVLPERKEEAGPVLSGVVTQPAPVEGAVAKGVAGVSEQKVGLPSGNTADPGPAPSVEGRQARTAPQKPAPAANERAAEPLRHTLGIKAVEEVWVEIWVDGKRPFDVILKPGESIERRAENGVYVVIGNAGGVEVDFDGKPVELTGRSGKVARLKLPYGYDFTVPGPVKRPAEKRKAEPVTDEIVPKEIAPDSAPVGRP